MSISALIAFGLLALPPGDCPGGCHPQHRLPLGGGQIAPSLGGELTESGTAEDLAGGEALVPPKPPEPAAPIVLLRPLEMAAADQQSFLASSDRPAYCPAVPFAPLSVQVQVPTSEAGLSAVEYVVLVLDGRPVEKNRYSVDPQPWAMPITGGQSFTPYVFLFPCPAPGKHILQARYKKAGLWSRVSEPLCFDVRLPDPPQIVAMSDLGRLPVPVQGAGLISITKPEMVIRLANVSQHASVVAYVDGRPISTELSHESCCRKIRLEGHLTPGTHSLRLRSTTSSGGCSVASDLSPEVRFHYYDSDIYLLRPGRSCDNRQHRAPAGCQGEGKSATESEAAGATSPTRPETVPLSPFYFASAAHFPLPDFGARGQIIDRGGLTIYEDMEFRFDRDGHYEVRFRATTPAMPTTVQLQFQIQPRPGGAWYTVTLAPIEFKHPDPNAAKRKCTAASDCSATQDQQCCGPVRDCVCKGHSEVLRRCYGEMGRDATIRRTGTARFGSGVDVP